MATTLAPSAADEAPVPAPAARAPRIPAGVARFLDTAGPLIGLLVVVGIICLKTDTREAFMTVANWKFIAVQTVIVATAALGMTIIIISGGIDLSVGSNVALCSVAGALFLRGGGSPTLAILLSVVCGGFIGLVNGTLITTLRLAPFIVTLGMLGIARGTAKYMANEQTVQMPRTWLNSMMSPFPTPSWLIVAPGVWILFGFAVFTYFLLNNTVFGRRVFAIGSNEAAARLCGIRVGILKPMIYTVGGLFFGLAGAMQLARLRQGDPTSAAGLELDIIAAVVIGGASLNGGVGGVVGSITGALIMAVLRNGSQQMGLPTYVQEIIIGAVIVLAVALDRVRHRGEASST